MKLIIRLLAGLSCSALVATNLGAAETVGSGGRAAATATTEANALQTGFAAQVGEHLKDLCAAGSFSGAVLVAHHGKRIFASACGLADRERGKPNSSDTQFRLASANKMFTAIAVLQLAESGKLRLDDTVGYHLRDYPNKQVAAEVTVRQLLNHTAGAGGIWGPEYEAHRLELRTLEDYERLNGSRGPDFPPGSKFQYSNYGYIVLGLIIEQVSGQSYYDYVQQHIYRVAGMNATGSEPEDVVVPARATGYSKRLATSGDWQSTSGTLPYRGTSAGGGYSTANDLLRFGVALSGHKLLSKRWTEILTTSTVDMEWPGFRYGCGFMETSVDGVRWVGHDGGSPGENAEFWLAPATDDVLIVLSNIDPPAAGTLAQWIAPRIPK